MIQSILIGIIVGLYVYYKHNKNSEKNSSVSIISTFIQLSFDLLQKLFKLIKNSMNLLIQKYGDYKRGLDVPTPESTDSSKPKEDIHSLIKISDDFLPKVRFSIPIKLKYHLLLQSAHLNFSYDKKTRKIDFYIKLIACTHSEDFQFLITDKDGNSFEYTLGQHHVEVDHTSSYVNYIDSVRHQYVKSVYVPIYLENGPKIFANFRQDIKLLIWDGGSIRQRFDITTEWVEKFHLLSDVMNKYIKEKYPKPL